MTLFLFDIKSCRNRAPLPSVSITLMKTTHPNGKRGCPEDLTTPQTDRQQGMSMGVGQMNMSVWYDYQGTRRRRWRMQTVWNDFWRLSHTPDSRVSKEWSCPFASSFIHSAAASLV